MWLVFATAIFSIRIQPFFKKMSGFLKTIKKKDTDLVMTYRMLFWVNISTIRLVLTNY